MERIAETEGKTINITYSEQQREKKLKKERRRIAPWGPAGLRQDRGLGSRGETGWG